MSSQLEQLLTCCICLDRFRNPKLLPCQHSVCMEPCMEGLVDYVRRQVKCPECRAEHRIPYNGVQGYPSNVTLQRFLEAHIEITGEMPDPHTGQIMERCAVCNEKNYLTTCAHCDKKICDDCKMAHSDILRREIGRVNNQVKRAIHRLKDHQTTVNRSITSLKNNSDSVLEEIENLNRRLSKAVRDRCNLLKNEAELYYTTELKNLSNIRTGLEQELSNAESNCQLADKYMGDDQIKWDDCELVDAKEIFLRTMDFIRNFDCDSNDYNRKARFSTPDDLNKIITQIKNMGDLILHNPKPNMDNISTSSLPAGLMKSKSDHRLAAQFRDQDDSYGGRSTSPGYRRKFGERPVSNENNDEFGSDSGRRRFRSRFMRREEEEERPSPKHEEEQVKQRQRVIDTEDVSRGPLSGITRMSDSPRVIQRLQEKDLPPKKKEVQQPPPPPAPTTQSKTMSSLSSRKTARQISEDEIDKIKKQNKSEPNISSKSSTAPKQLQTRDTSVKESEPTRFERTFRSTPSIDEETRRPSTGSRQETSYGRPVGRKVSEPSTSQTSTSFSRMSSTSPSRDRGKLSSSRNSRTSELEPKRSSTDSSRTTEIRTNRLSNSKSMSTPSSRTTGRYHSRVLDRAATPVEASNDSEDDEDDEDEDEEETSEETDTEETEDTSADETEVSKSTSSKSQSQISSSTGSSSRAKFEELREKRQRLARSKSSAGVDDEEEETVADISSKSKGIKQNEEKNDSKDDSSQLSNWARYLKNKYGNKTGAGASSSSLTSRALSRSRSSHLLGLAKEESSEEDARTVKTPPSIPGQAGIMGPLTFGNIHRSKYLQKQRTLLKIGSRGSEAGNFTWPRGIAVGPNNIIVVADSSNHRVQTFDQDGTYISEFGGYGNGEGEFDCLAGVAVNRIGQYIIADRYNHRIQIFDSRGLFLKSFGSQGNADGKFSYPWGVATDAIGYIYVCDKENHRIQVFQSDGTFAGKFGSIGNKVGQLEHPHYVAVSSTNTVIVSDSNNHRVQMFDANGKMLQSFGCEGSENGQFKFPRGVAVDTENLIYVADSGNNRIQIFKQDGSFVRAFGCWGSGDGEFKGLEGVAVMPNGKIMVCDRENHRVQVFEKA